MGNLEELKEFLDEKVEKFNHQAFIETDPIQIPRQYSKKEDVEISGFLASTIAWGNRRSIIMSGFRLMEMMGNHPYDFVMNASSSDIKQLDKFIHRTFNGLDCMYFVRSLKNIYKQHGGLQQVFEKGFQLENSVKSSLSHFHSVFFEISGERTRKHISNVKKGSAGKRLNMYLRWMVRKDMCNVDFGIWKKIPSSELMLPLDVHTGNVARKLGLLNRNSNDWKAVEEVTFKLRTFDSNDPVKYDFALFGLGAFEKF